MRFAERGRLNTGKRDYVRSGKPLAGSTINPHLTQAASVFTHAKRLRLVPRTFMSPTRGIERSPAARGDAALAELNDARAELAVIDVGAAQ